MRKILSDSHYVAIIGIFHAGNQWFLRQGEVPGADLLLQLLKIGTQAFPDENRGDEIPRDRQDRVALHIQDPAALFFDYEADVKFPVQVINGILAARLRLPHHKDRIVSVHGSPLRLF